MPDITLPARDGGSFTAYIAMPGKLPAPVVILIQEIFGVNAEMRSKCDEYASAGFIAVCPDLFWRLEPEVQLTDRSKAEWDKAFDLMNRFDIDQGVEDLRAVEHSFKGHAQSTGKVGCVGYCLGGKLAYLMATRTHIDCAVSYYGIGFEHLLSEASGIEKPAMLHIAEKDKFSSDQAREKVLAGLGKNPLVTLHVYPGVDHAFARGGGEHYDKNMATLADSRTREFLSRTLSSS
jgi:carboxymethylenebutenolidase